MRPLDLLSRTEKWFLGGGKGALYAPPFPKHLPVPGFWDEAYLADVRLQRLFTLILTDSSGKPLRLDSKVESWRPDRLAIRHAGDGFTLLEHRMVLDNCWVSEVELINAQQPIEVFLWSLQDVRPFGFGTPWQSVTGCKVEADQIDLRYEVAWPPELKPDRTAVESEQIAATGAHMQQPFCCHLALGSSLRRESFTVNLAQRHDDAPLYETSVLPEKLSRGRLAGDQKLFVGTQTEGLLHIVQHYRLEPGATARFGCGAGTSAETAAQALREGLKEGASARSEKAWSLYFEGVPQFKSSDPFLDSAYWYRWYGLRLNTVDMPDMPRLNTPYVTEGIGFFRNFITYSAQAHLREVSWMRDPGLAIGILDNLVQCQRADGSFPGHNYTARPERDFYHADFATGIMQLNALHPGAVGRDHTAMLRRYADYYLRHRTLTRDPAGPTLYDVFDQNETGQEYMSRYQFVSEAADRWESFRVSGMDATAYAQMMFSALARLRAADSSYRHFSQGALKGLAYKAFDAADSFFCDVDPNGKRSPARPATGFYPLLSPDLRSLADLLPAGALDQVVERWLTNEGEFWLQTGFPATSITDETFSDDGEWKERRLNCPWNGRSWPMANSHVVDALANYARQINPSARGKAAEALLKAIRLLFHNGDPSRPCCYEHYNPITGRPALYRGYDDYMHSWIVDLILRHAVGIQPGSSEIDPLPLDVDLTCAATPNNGRLVDVEIKAGKRQVTQR